MALALPITVHGEPGFREDDDDDRGDGDNDGGDHGEDESLIPIR